MAKKLAGKVAVVTGSSTGIGRGIAIALAGEGAKVVVNGISRDSDGTRLIDQVVEEIKKANRVAVGNYDSVATMAGGANIIKDAIDNFGRIDILVNCAGNYWNAITVEMTEEEWDSIIAVHLKGHFSCTKAALPHMIQQKSGRIINIASRAAFDGIGNPAYATAKAGVLGFSSYLSRELKPQDITVNAILPSAVTELFPTEKKQTGDNMPYYKSPHPDMIAPLAVYLATDEAQDITGRFFYAAAGDICVYVHPFRLSSAHTFIRKSEGKWTVDELSEVIPPVLGLG